MPVSKYYGGHGSEVMANMMKEYGAKKGKQVFYATANKRGMKPASGGRKGVIRKRPHGSGPFSDADMKRGYRVCG